MHTILDEWTEEVGSTVRKTSVKRWNRMRKTEIIELEQKKITNGEKSE